jgi:hypothetical protein
VAQKLLEAEVIEAEEFQKLLSELDASVPIN